MENFPFRFSYDGEKMPNANFSQGNHHSEALDITKSSLKMENMISPLFVPHDFRKRRLSSYDITSFFTLAKEEDYIAEMQDHLKAEAFPLDPQYFAQQVQIENARDQALSAKIQDYAVDCYRISRSRGPSFSLGPGRKASEDLFAHSFDLLNYFRNHEQNERPFHNETLDQRVQQNFLDEYRATPLVPNALPGAFAPTVDNNFQYGLHSINMDTLNSRDSTLNHAIQINQEMMNSIGQQVSQQISQEVSKDRDESKISAEFEPKNKKKRKLNNTQEVLKEEVGAESSLRVKKSKSEVKKVSNTININSAQLKSSRIASEKPSAKKPEITKAPKGKKAAAKKGIDVSEVKAEHIINRDAKSTAPTSTNVSPNPKKEDISGIFRSNPMIAGTFGHFKKPENAQELLGGLTLPAEVEEYINNSKLFNQIKAPVMRKIGTLTLDERRIKIEKYIEKRKRRTWNKRVNYDCRKKVADNRLRIKGRFVTKEQAFAMMEAYGISFDPEKITNTEIKDLLTARFGAAIPKKKEIMGVQGVDNVLNIHGQSMKVEENDDYSDGDQENSSFGSQEDSLNESYL